MRALKHLRTVCVVGVLAASVFMLSACTTPENESGDTKVEGLTGGVAATVNGAEIEEDTITTQIQNLRASQGYGEADAWGQWLADSDQTPESYREQWVDSYVELELVKQAAEEKGIKVESSETDEYVNKMKSNYDSDESWQEALKASGTTEDKYREAVENALISQKLNEEVTKDVEVTDEEIMTQAPTYLTSYDGAKKSSHILFNASDEAQAQEIHDQLVAGSLDFAEAAKEYSQDTGSAEKGGDIGWDKLSNLVEPYTEALKTLEQDQISDLVQSQYGYHIIKVTEVFTAPEELTSLDQIPSEFQETLKTSILNNKKREAYTTWAEEYKESADIVINPMPENVPYNVDMNNYSKTEDDTDSSNSDTGTTPQSDGSETPQPDTDESAPEAEAPSEGEAPVEGDGTQEGDQAAQPEAA